MVIRTSSPEPEENGCTAKSRRPRLKSYPNKPAIFFDKLICKSFKNIPSRPGAGFPDKAVSRIVTRRGRIFWKMLSNLYVVIPGSKSFKRASYKFEEDKTSASRLFRFTTSDSTGTKSLKFSSDLACAQINWLREVVIASKDAKSDGIFTDRS